jgi:polyisoprenoid-binding protein YceI
MLSALGHNPTIAIRDFTGEANFDPAAPGQASLRIRIRADSLEVTDDIKSKDRMEMESLMNQKVLESSKYPVIVYESAEVSADQLGEGRYRTAINGNLSLHGTTRRLPVTAQVTVTGDMLRAYGEFSILQSNYGIPLVNVAGGALKLKDELKFTFDIVGRRQE